MQGIRHPVWGNENEKIGKKKKTPVTSHVFSLVAAIVAIRFVRSTDRDRDECVVVADFDAECGSGIQVD